MSLSTDPRLTRVHHRSRSTLLFFYIWQRFLLTFSLAFTGCMILLFIASLFDDLVDFLLDEVGFLPMLKYFLFLQLDSLVSMLPIAMFFSTLFCLISLDRYGELQAMWGTGLSTYQLVLPILLSALLIAPFHIFLTEFVSPSSKKSADQLKERFTKPDINQRALFFRNKKDRRDWFFEYFTRQGPSRGVIITQFRKDHSVEWELRAKEGVYHHKKWSFINAHLSYFPASKHEYLGTTQSHPSLTFSKLSETPNDFIHLLQIQSIETLTLPEMIHLLKQHKKDLPMRKIAALKTYVYHRFTTPLTAFFLVLSATALVIYSRRMNSSKNAAIAIAIILSYYMIINTSLALGKAEILTPFFAGSFPCIILIAIALFAIRKR